MKKSVKKQFENFKMYVRQRGASYIQGFNKYSGYFLAQRIIKWD
jgi:hypothetical protein